MSSVSRKRDSFVLFGSSVVHRQPILVKSRQSTFMVEVLLHFCKIYAAGSAAGVPARKAETSPTGWISPFPQCGQLSSSSSKAVKSFRNGLRHCLQTNAISGAICCR
ncbi:hypothetical protein DVH05_002385 [Phytophthora capsici]|nr:hypothetical protein DVH05_002385 [Phytophthora capsici]